MNNKLAISHDHLIKLAGKPAFNRGMQYFRDKHVRALKQSNSRISAEVEGSETYHIILKWTSKQLDGACNCPASDGFDFCKHCVAVALTLMETQAIQNELAQGGTESRIKAYLLKQEKEKLTDWLLEQIENDPILLQQWSLKADRDLGVLDLKAFKKRITAAIPYKRNSFRYQQVRNYFAPVEIIADQIGEITEQFPADDMLKLIDYALARINRALEHIDDSGGFRLAAVDALHRAHIISCKRLDWPKKKLVRYLLDIAFGDQLDIYPEIPADYSDALGNDGLLLFTGCLQEKWDALPPLERGANFDQKWPYLHLQQMLEKLAGLSSDEEAIIRLRQKTAVDLHDYQDLAQRCLKTGDLDATEQWLKKCQQSTDRDYHFTTQHLQISLLKAKQCWSEALEQQWKLYSKSLRLKDYIAIPDLAKNADDKNNWQQQALKLLKKQAQSQPETNAWMTVTQTDHLLEFYLYHEAFDEALELVAKEKADPNLLFKLAWKIINRPEQAFPIFQRVIEHQVMQANNNAYKEAIQQLQDINNSLKGTKQKQQMATLIETLRQKNRAKRNFIKWLNEDFE